MRLPNGYGSISKLSGNRRKPYMVVLTQGYVRVDLNIKRNRIVLGYYPTKKEALKALTEYHENPYDIKVNTITFEELYERWSEDHFKKLANKSSIRTYNAAFRHSEPIHKMRVKDIRPNHLEGTIENAQVGDATKSRMKSMYNLMFRYALKYDIVDKNYAELCNSVKVERNNVRVPFTSEEVQMIWDRVDDIPFADMVLFAIYSGFRPTELTLIKNENVHLEEGYIVGGMKTKAGTDRSVPIHPMIREIVKKRFNEQNEYLFSDYNMFEHEVVQLSYDKYRGRFYKVMKALKMNHNPHETRHTFITQAKHCEVDDYMLKRIIGHEIRDVTEKVYTHRSIEELKNEMAKIIF
jgi:integrase